MTAQREQEELEKLQSKKEVSSKVEVTITPGRAPAEGADEEIEYPTHERWEEHTPERDPAEG